MTYDICAYTNKVFTSTFSCADYTSVRAGIINGLEHGGWTEIAEDDYLSQQSPWLDGSTPSYYKGKVRVKLGKWGDGTLTIQAGNEDFSVSHSGMYLHRIESNDINYRVAGDKYTMIVNPYQFALYLEYPQTAGFNQWGCIVSSIQVPRFVQNTLRVIDAIVAIPINNFRLYTTHIGEMNNYFLHFNSQAGGSHTRHNESGNKIGSFGFLHYSLGGMTDQPYGDPIISPPFVCWNLASEYYKATINGFLWDSIIINKNLVVDSSFLLDGHNWRVYGNNTKEGSLTFVTGGLS